ncbi:MAG: nucleotide exchange factor GrpE [Ruminococcus sp.]|nr:nucleotide exchange factor GrpE [Ruminococcus sp.]
MSFFKKERKGKKMPETKDEKIEETTVSEETTETAENVEVIDENAEKIKALEEELAASKDMYLRLRAEYDNFRKRTANEKLSLYDDATAKAVAELLPVADSVTMALANLKDSSPEILKGIELISNQLAKSFEKLNVEAFGAIGDTFNPELHNAISKVDDENLGENTLAQIFQIGYKKGDKIIRHAMVQVANCN